MSCYSSTTSFSSYKSPRSAPTPPTPSSAVQCTQYPSGRRPSITTLSSKEVYSHEDKFTRHPYVSLSPSECVRKGYVGVQRDSLRSWSWTRKVWVVLSDQWLCTSQREGSAVIHALPLSQVRIVEHVERRRRCMVVGTSSQTWYLLFKDNVSLHAWYYDIHVRCPLMHIGRPTNVRHEMHVVYDAAASEISGLPESWIETLSSWDVGSPFENSHPYMESDLVSPVTEPTLSPLPARSTGSLESEVHPRMPKIQPVQRRQRSASVAVSSTITPSVALSVDHFRRSPNRFRDINARDLTGAVQLVRLLPAFRTESCDIWKAGWSGSFGRRKVAIQVIRLTGPGLEGDQAQLSQLSSIILREVKVLHQLRHPYVVRIRGFCRDQGPLPALVSTWLPRGNIMKYLESHRPTVGRIRRLKFLTEVASGINYLHNFSPVIVHGNLSGIHILLSEHDTACISGFGINPVLEEMETHSESVTFTSLSPRWAAPEVIRLGRRHLTTCSDVFSYARTVVEVMTGKDPFHHIADSSEVLQTVLRGVLPRRPPVFGEDALWQFLERCWSEEPAQRPSMALVLLRIEEILCSYQVSEPEPPHSN